jgi:predicted nucleic acid-binding protein
VSRLVVDASVAVKWVVTEEGTSEAVALLGVPGLLRRTC